MEAAGSDVPDHGYVSVLQLPFQRRTTAQALRRARLRLGIIVAVERLLLDDRVGVGSLGARVGVLVLVGHGGS